MFGVGKKNNKEIKTILPVPVFQDISESDLSNLFVAFSGRIRLQP